ncbi:MAG: Ty1/Copia family ribonuclease HI, partial [Cyanobacteria bacterium J06648_11]
PRRTHLNQAWKVLGYLLRTADAKLRLSGALLPVPPSATDPAEFYKTGGKSEPGSVEDIEVLDQSDRCVEDRFSDDSHIDLSYVDGFDRLDLDDVRGIAPHLRDCLKQFRKTVKLTVFTDADFAGETKERRSTIGYVIYLNSSPIIWTTRRIKTVTTSTFETECIAVSEACKDVQALLLLGRSLGIEIDLPVTIYNDNMSTAYIASNQASAPKQKYTQIRFHHVRNHVRHGIVRIMHCSTTEMVADLFTKPLRMIQHYKLASELLDFDRDTKA